MTSILGATRGDTSGITIPATGNNDFIAGSHYQYGTSSKLVVTRGDTSGNTSADPIGNNSSRSYWEQ